MNITQKWGFGMAPISEGMQGRYDLAVDTVLSILDGEHFNEELALESISEVKGMFNRCIRQDQWDWYSVHTLLGKPSSKIMKPMVNHLNGLRRAIKEDDISAFGLQLKKAQLLGLKGLLLNFLRGEDDNPRSGGWVYILSTREQPDILKIGMTTRSISARVREINSATGVLIPFSARAVFSVKDPAKTEAMIFKRLADCRIRSDREFFKLPYKDATSTIVEILKELQESSNDLKEA